MPDGVSRGVVILEECGSVDNERRGAIAKNRRPAEECSAAVDTVELLHDDFLLADELIDDEGRASLRQLDEHYLSTGAGRRGQTDPVAESDRGKYVVSNRHDFLALHLEQHRLRES